MSRIEREKQTVRKMIELYCRHRLKQVNIPEEYQHLAEFACRRLDHCKYGEKKTAPASPLAPSTLISSRKSNFLPPPPHCPHPDSAGFL